MARVQGLSMFWFKMFSGSESISFRAVPLEKCFDFMWLNLLSPFPQMGWVVGGAAAESLACPCRKEGWVHQDLGSSDAHVLFTGGLEPSLTFWASPVRAHLQPRWGSSSHQVVIQELSLILPVSCNRRKMRRSWYAVLRPGFPRHAAESSLCSPCVWLESASLTLKPPAAEAFADGPSSHLHTHTCCTHRIKENCEPFLSVLSCGWRTIHLRCRLVKIVCRGLLSKTVASAAGLQGNCLGPHSNPPLSVSPTL